MQELRLTANMMEYITRFLLWLIPSLSDSRNPAVKKLEDKLKDQQFLFYDTLREVEKKADAKYSPITKVIVDDSNGNEIVASLKAVLYAKNYEQSNFSYRSKVQDNARRYRRDFGSY